METSQISVKVMVKYPRLMYWSLSVAYLTGTLRWLRDPIIRHCIAFEAS